MLLRRYYEPSYYHFALHINGRLSGENAVSIERVAQAITSATHYGWNVQSDALGFTITTVCPDGDLWVYSYEAMLP